MVKPHRVTVGLQRVFLKTTQSSDFRKWASGERPRFNGVPRKGNTSHQLLSAELRHAVREFLQASVVGSGPSIFTP